MHFYRNNEGRVEPYHLVPNVSGGGMRPTRIADARKAKAVPSVTTIIDLLAKPALNDWLVKQGALAAFKTPPEPKETPESFAERILLASQEPGQTAADRGTDLHNALERALQGRVVTQEERKFTDPILEYLHTLNDEWTAEQAFIADGYGGKVDAFCPGIVVDFKSKDMTPETVGKKMAYDQNIQLAPYRMGLKMPKARCINLFVSRTVPGCFVPYEWSEEKLEQGWQAFQGLMMAWYAIKDYEMPERIAA